ncbi:alpha/beta fold hydrolase [Shewanella sp. 10N.286.45.A1]|uniref:alpha/beta fold hydrolase n=1 Tax=Shewanella sp. 10N.286.45.A1 TaxID=3229694 RepID=UPI00354F7D63
MEKSVEIQLSKNGKNLYIFFGGIAAGISMPPFEFYNASGILDENKIFIRDFEQNWYQSGLVDISNNIIQTAAFIRGEIDKINPEKLYFIGNSMGGYAAILFGNLIGTGEVIAFAPQTFISPMQRFKNRDFRWSKQIFSTYIKCFLKDTAFDLRKILIDKPNDNRISIFVSTGDRLDYIHANHLKGIDGVTVFEFDSGGHGIVKQLRDEGKLTDIMSGKYT